MGSTSNGTSESWSGINTLALGCQFSIEVSPSKAEPGFQLVKPANHPLRTTVAPRPASCSSALRSDPTSSAGLHPASFPRSHSSDVPLTWESAFTVFRIGQSIPEIQLRGTHIPDYSAASLAHSPTFASPGLPFGGEASDFWGNNWTNPPNRRALPSFLTRIHPNKARPLESDPLNGRLCAGVAVAWVGTGVGDGGAECCGGSAGREGSTGDATYELLYVIHRRGIGNKLMFSFIFCFLCSRSPLCFFP